MKMLFHLVRVLICAAVFCALFFPLKKLTKLKDIAVFSISFLVAMSCMMITSNFPIENLFITFDSHQAAYEYGNSGQVKYIIEGQQADMVIATNDDGMFYCLFPKTEDGGLKLASASDVSVAAQKVSGTVVVNVFRFRDTEDYFVAIMDSEGAIEDLADQKGSTFICAECPSSGGTAYVYHAYVKGYNSTYEFTAGGVTYDMEADPAETTAAK